MILINILLVFLAGYAFSEWIVPFFDNLFATIGVWFQKHQGEMAVSITADSVKATKLKQEIHQRDNSRAIGFVIPGGEEEEEYYEDE